MNRARLRREVVTLRMPVSAQEWRQARRIWGSPQDALKREIEQRKNRKEKEKIDDRDRSGGGCFEGRTFQSLA